jgi:hypothetical protein
MNTDATTPAPGHTPKAEAVAALRLAQASGEIPRALEFLAAPLAILDARRAVIFANKAFQVLAGAAGIEDVRGNRPGDVLRCVHARTGCGDGEACGFCGARRAVGETQSTGRPASRECHITVNAPGRPLAHDLLVKTTPFEIGGTRYVMVSFSDISDLKRRGVLERLSAVCDTLEEEIQGQKLMLSAGAARSQSPLSRNGSRSFRMTPSSRGSSTTC